MQKNYIEPDSIKNIFLQDQNGYFTFYLKKVYNVIFECHQLTKIRKLILNKSIKNQIQK